jgi:hypothetical protein
MSSEVEICNMALSNIRAGSINSLNEQSLAAQQCKLKYGILRDRVLAETWGFNHRLEPLQLTTHEVLNWTYVYVYPNTCLKINRLASSYEELTNDTDYVSRLLDSELININDIRRRTPHEVFNVEGDKVIGANESDLYIDYAMKVTDPNLFSTDFIIALSHLLASEIAVPIAGYELGANMRKDELDLYNAYLSAASSNDTNEDYTEPPLSEFETTRR